MMYTLLGFLLMSFFAVSFQDDVKIRYEPIGCFNDMMKEPRPLPVLIKSFRGGQIDWHNLNNTIEACAKVALKKNYLYFALQFYGECWSGPQAHLTYDRDGRSKRCTLGVGKQRANMVYMFAGKENECTDYHILNSSDRSMNHSLAGPPKCDHWVQNPSFKDVNRWYRFTGKAGQAMPEKCVDPFKCQTFVSGWMDGKHPEVVDGIQDRRACFSWKNNCCYRSTQIRVRNCGKFYVYNLPSTKGCQERYCGNGVTSSISV
ncbi:pancreatic secretory granule membrane major glycoprotein GP2-like [Orbicella faveolata]|uniref:pancreatic secretory granule membrane major glycoprotein GP2-like n=1 Tax=Orbicella faveolata TaxID=48498 RepID=UPI0009E575D7|nr:pancreatic secretory granule membrane major glycoprotein GP2-like [Orbicella faveolata]